VVVGRKQGTGGKRNLLEGRPGETTPSKVSLRHVTVPDAELRLDQALELLLGGTLSPCEIVEGQALNGDQDVEHSTADGNAT